jgi:hypothetical protein
VRAREFITESEQKDYFHGSKFGDEEGNSWSVEKVLDFAKSNPEYLKKDFPLNKIRHDLEWWEDNPEQRKRMANADTKYPLLVLQNDDGHLSVADGLNRMKKATSIEKRKTIDVYLVPKKDIMDLADKEIDETASTGQGGGSAGSNGGQMVGGPTTYEKEYNMFKRKGPRRITAMTNEELPNNYATKKAHMLKRKEK